MLTCADGRTGARAASRQEIYAGGQVPVTALSRCAAALGTLPVVARHHPGAVVVWFDAHGDLETPQATHQLPGRPGAFRRRGPVGLGPGR